VEGGGVLNGVNGMSRGGERKDHYLCSQKGKKIHPKGKNEGSKHP